LIQKRTVEGESAYLFMIEVRQTGCYTEKFSSKRVEEKK